MAAKPYSAKSYPMHFGICPLSVVPLRSSPSHRSEMVSQLLFGELVDILEEKNGKWIRVRCANDNFVAWMESSQIKAITPSEFLRYNDNFAYSLEFSQPILEEDHVIQVSMGARLPDFDGLRFPLGDLNYTFSGQTIFPGQTTPTADLVLKIAKRYLNTPFLLGGRTPFGIDSAGLAQQVYQMAGIKLPREAALQIEYGETVDFVQQAKPGDLAFFENSKGKISHVGILLPDDRILHAYGSVRVDLVDHYGIYQEDKKVYCKKLRLVKRVLPFMPETLQVEQENETVFAQQGELFA